MSWQLSFWEVLDSIGFNLKGQPGSSSVLHNAITQCYTAESPASFPWKWCYVETKLDNLNGHDEWLDPKIDQNLASVIQWWDFQAYLIM